MSIYFADQLFTEPERLTSWKPPYMAGIYAILVDDPSNPKVPFRPIYFGETDDMSEKGLIQNHPLHDCWYKQTKSVYRLYIALCQMPDSTQAERHKLKIDLIKEYRPFCNEPTTF